MQVGCEVCVKSDLAWWTMQMKAKSGSRFRVLPDNVCES